MKVSTMVELDNLRIQVTEAKARKAAAWTAYELAMIEHNELASKFAEALSVWSGRRVK